ncbi:hypothetical protein QR680_004857 [Steinernema hermaphroditum]|uniref:Cystatin domain-containing protein n=1 Tax=Steinernema hermaphroditum TaxID=289476 RepID=A0AA39LTW3_9BILA|nr:hypothetical protein QR680_004857 [Steinernema hermaphroditum]
MLTLGCLVLLFSAVHLQIEGPPRSIDTKDLQRAALAAINAQTRNLLCLLPYKILSASKLNSTGYEVKFEVIQSECLASKLRAGAATRNRGKHFVYVVMLG